MSDFSYDDRCGKSNDDADFDALVCRVVGEIESGQPIDLTALAARSPAYAERLRELLPALEAMIGLGGEKPLLSSHPLGASVDNQPSVGTAGVLGEFRIDREIGRGGMGVVYEARQLSLGRRVALKVLPFAALMDRQQLARFKNEARAAATLDHPNIVAVHSVGSERGVHFYAMQYIDGRSMAEVITELRRATRPATSGPVATPPHNDLIKALAANGCTPEPSAFTGHPTAGEHAETLSTSAQDRDTKRELQAGITTRPSTHTNEYFRTVADWGIQAADALDHAHARGVVHRDVKPGNLLIDGTGKLWVADFGLARIETEASLTMTGDLLGTLRYMSPEQALAKREVVDHRSDIYSLGATIYELLTLQPPYAGHDRQELLRQIAFEEPRRPRQITCHIPVDLETIVGKAMEKNPADRYATAREMADDFRRFLASEPIRARPATVVQRLSKWTRRHMAVVWSAAAAMLLSTVVLTVASLLVARWYREAERQRELVVQQLEEVHHQQAATRAAEAKEAAARAEVERSKYVKAMSTAGQLLQRGDGSSLFDVLHQYVPQPGMADLRGWEWYYCLANGLDNWRTFDGHTDEVESVAWSPNGDYLATGGRDKRLILWDPKSGRIVKTLGESDYVASLGWSLDGRRLAAGLNGGRIRIWDIKTGKEIQTIVDATRSTVNEVAWSPDGAYFATCEYGHAIIIRHPESGEVVQTIPGKPDETPYFDWSPDGQYLAYRVGTNGQGMEVKIWDVRQGRDREQVLRSSAGYGWAKWSPDGKKLAVAADTVFLWDPFSGKEIRRLGTKLNAERIAWSPSGDRIAIVESGEEQPTRRVSIWDSELKQMLRSTTTLFGKMLRTSWSWSPDGKYLASGGEAGLVKVWQVAPTGAELGVRAATRCLDFSPDGSQVAAADEDGTVRIVSLADRRERVLTSYEQPKRIGWSPGGKYLAIGGGLGYVSICDLRTGNEIFQFPIDGKLQELAWLPDGAKLAVTVAPDDVLTIWNIDERRQICRVDGNRKIVNSTPLNHKLIAGGQRTFDIIDPSSGKSMLAIEIPPEVVSGRRAGAAAWSPDATLIAAGAESLAWLADPATGHPIKLLRGHNERVRSVTWRPDGEQLATVSPTELIIWNVRSGQAVFSIGGEFGASAHAVWYPDGKTIVVFWNEGIAVFDAARGYELAGRGAYDFERAHRLAAVGKSAEAVDLMKQIADRFPEHEPYVEAWRRHALRTHSREADGFISKEDWQHAVAELDEALKLAPERRDLLLQRASARLKLGEHKKSIADYTAAIEQSDEEPLPRLRRGISHRALKQFEQAERDFQRALELAEHAPDPAEALNGAAWALATDPSLDSGVAKWAVSMAQRATSLVPDNWGILNTLGVAYCRAGNWDSAIKTLRLAREIGGLDGPAVDGYFLAMGYARQGERDEAQRWFDACERWVAFQGGNEELLRFRTEAADTLGFKVDPIMRVKPTPSDVQAMLHLFLQADPDAGWINAEVGNWRKAADAYARAVQETPELINLYYFLALTRLKLGDDVGYRDACDLLLRRAFTENDDERDRLAWTCALGPNGLDDRDVPLKQSEAVVAHQPHNAAYRCTLGASLYRQSQYEQAAQQLTRSIAVFDSETNAISDAYPRLLLAMAYWHLGRRNEARHLMVEIQPAIDKALADPTTRWNRRVTLELLRAEADDLLKSDRADKDSPADANAAVSKSLSSGPLPLQQ